MIRVGLTMRVEVLADRGERRDALDQAWHAVCADAGVMGLPLTNRPGTARGQLEALGLGGVILTGGNDIATSDNARGAAPERDEFERELLDACEALGLPVLGVCRGMQMIAVHYGSSLTRVKNHVATVHEVHGTGDKADSREVNSFHEHGILADNLHHPLTATWLASDGTVEGLRHQQLPVQGIMWHPERGEADSRDIGLISQLFAGRTG